MHRHRLCRSTLRVGLPEIFCNTRLGNDLRSVASALSSRRQISDWPTYESATALAGAAFDANAAGAGADDFVAAAHRTGDSHEDAAQRDSDAVGVAIAVSVLLREGGIVRRTICNHVDHLFVASAR